MMIAMTRYEVYDHAGQIPLNEWHSSGIEVPVFDKDNTLTSFHDSQFIDEVIKGLIANGLPDLFPIIALVSNSNNPKYMQGVGSDLGKRLGGVDVLTVCQSDGYPSKPNPAMGLRVAKLLGAHTHELGIIGDRRLIDVRFGTRLGAGRIALCHKVGYGDACGVPTLRRIESVLVGVECVLGLAGDHSLMSEK